MTGGRLVALVALVVGTLASVPGADLGSELANWGPVATGHHDASQGVWFADGAAIATTRARLDGLSTVDRDGSPLDGQVTLGRLWDRSHNAGEFGGTYSFHRIQLRAGTDPQAESSGTAFATLGGAIHFPIMLSFQAEAGRSQERGLLASGEASLLFVRVRVDHDDQVDTVRVGTGPRILGTTAPLAWGVLVDWASTHATLSNGINRSTEGAIGQGFIIVRIANRWLLGASVTGVTAAIDRLDPTGHESGQVEAAMTIGATF